jgi:type II restriction/modification system DNA methylase subunit YeeA
MPIVTVADFVAKWKASTLSERSAAQQHFLDICAVLGKPGPAQADPTGESYAFEKGVTKTGSKTGRVDGFADVWKRNHFAIEYKGKKKNLSDAYQQLLAYREDLENPPLLAVCDLNRFEIHTNFTGTVKRIFAFDLDALQANQPTETCALPPLTVLRGLFESPDSLRPAQTTAAVTEEAAKTFGQLARSLTLRGHDPHQAAHFLIRLLFCLFAEDVGLLPNKLFTDLISNFQKEPETFQQSLSELFSKMAVGGRFGAIKIKHFNGGLFDDDSTLPLIESELATLAKAADLDWSCIEPSIFGTLFERSLDPAKRSQLGAHYTSREDINLIVEPVVMLPLRREWAQVKDKAEALAAERDAVIAEQEAKKSNVTDADRRDMMRRRNSKDNAMEDALKKFQERLSEVKVLDPACGSGNFLYVALRSLLDLEKSVIQMAAHCGLMGFFPRVGPEQMRGLEINDYAHELAPITVWIGYIQWLRENGFGEPEQPILKRFELIKQQDAILNPDGTEATWPEADFIIGNPPFLGGKFLRNGNRGKGGLGDKYVDQLFNCFGNRIPNFSDLVCYWFEKAQTLVQTGKVRRVGLISTNSIRGGANRKVLERIARTGGIFNAWSDRDWVLDGAAVRVSLTAFDNGTEKELFLDGVRVASINPDLTADSANTTTALKLPENAGICFMADIKGGAFDIAPVTAQRLLAAGGNPNGKPNSDVVRPWANASDITGKNRGIWIIDFGVGMEEDEASLYEAPFEFVRQNVYPIRSQNRKAIYARRWWLHAEPCAGMRAALAPIKRFIVTPGTSKHRLFVWLEHPTLPDHALMAIARDDDYFFGILHSRFHETWALRLGTSLGVGNDPRYTPSTTFETFPFPWPPGQEPSEADSPQVKAIADAARDLVTKRNNWLTPPDLAEAELKKRTLTNLYNQRPSWLDTAHRKLDEAVAAAYGWNWPMEDKEILEKLLKLNFDRLKY